MNQILIPFPGLGSTNAPDCIFTCMPHGITVDHTCRCLPSAAALIGCGSHDSLVCSEEQIKAVVQHAMAEARSPSEGLYFDDFRKILARSPLGMGVDLPSDV